MLNRTGRGAIVAVLIASSSIAVGLASAADGKAKDPLRERGRYVVMIGGCNDCHTPGYAPSGGKVDEKQWLVGDMLGWRGPWGTTYPVNLRLYMQKLTEKEWVAQARHLQARPPMPFWALEAMSDRDLRAIYRFVRSLGPAGQPAPDFVPPDREPKPPYVTFPAPPK
jgi:mono/diheme cytochrome c family protein